jgi:hypothetical protein
MSRISRENCLATIQEHTALRAEVMRLRAALKDTEHFFLGHFDDNCEECRRGLAMIKTALRPVIKT